MSVIIPVHNRAGVLARALDSVAAQTWRDLEVIVVDDGSDDDVGAVVGKRSDPPVILLRHPERRGAPAARNTGLARAAGSLIAFLDSDDAWLPEKLERQVAAFDGGDAALGLVFTAVRKVPDEAFPWTDPQSGDLARDLLIDNRVGTASAPLIRKDLLAKVGGFDPALESCQDWDLWIRLSEVCAFAAIPAPLTIHYDMPDSITADVRRSARGHRMFARKHAGRVGRLPRADRARHHLRLATAFYWKRAWWDFLHHVLRAAALDCKLSGRILAFLRDRVVSRLRKWRGGSSKADGAGG